MHSHPCELPDESLLRECRVETFRGSGPGGQKRNKTSSAVRIVHLPSGVNASASESRSQIENRRKAFTRLRLALAIGIRREFSERPAWWPEVTPSVDRAGEQGPIEVGVRSPLFCPAVAIALDALASAAGSTADAAGLLGTNSADLIRFLESDPHVWATAQRIRTVNGKRPLRRG